VLQAARWKCKTRKSPKFAIWAPSHNFVGLYLRNLGTYRQSEKLLYSNVSHMRLYNMVNFGPQAAGIVLLVWDTPANVNGFRILAELLHGNSSSGRQPNFAALNRGRDLYSYSAGRPSRWVLAHISSSFFRSFRSEHFLRCLLTNIVETSSHDMSLTPISALLCKFCKSTPRVK